MAKEIKIISRPNCDLCKENIKENVPAYYDSKTIFGCWAYLCCECFLKFTHGKLGTGIGQRLILVETTTQNFRKE